MKLSMIALTGIPAVSSLLFDVAAMMRHSPPAAPVPEVADEPAEPDEDEDDRLESELAALMWIRAAPQPS